MKRTGIINRDLSALVATLGHRDEITICDAGLPCPPGVAVIDLSLTLGLPSIWTVFETLRQELVIEGVVWANEAKDHLVDRFQAEMDIWATGGKTDIARATESHEAFKHRTGTSRAIIRTGDVTPYANVILICGVAF